MGEFEIYCALCGGPFRLIEPYDGDDNDDSDEEEMGYDPEFISDDEMEWLEHYRVLGFNPDSYFADKCFLTGEGFREEYGAVEALAGSDPNVPEELSSGTHEGQAILRIQVYSGIGSNHSPAIPIHNACYSIFAQNARCKLQGQQKGVADQELVVKEMLWNAMNTRVHDWMTVLMVDYGELAEGAGEQFWNCVKGEEFLVANPFTSPQITRFLKDFSESTTKTLSNPTKSATADTYNLPNNPFTSLADEILHEILLYLPYPSLQSFILSGLTTLSLHQAPSFWHRRLTIEMPFLWDLSLQGQPDFFRMYHELRRQCFAAPAQKVAVVNNRRLTSTIKNTDKSLVLGLANRRRVWHVCEQIFEIYSKLLKERDEKMGELDEEEKNEFVKGSFSLQMPPVANPIIKGGRSLFEVFVSSWEDIETKKRKEAWVAFNSNEDGRLCGVELRYGQDPSLGGFFGDRGERTSIVDVPEGEWIKGIEWNIRGAEDVEAGVKIGVTGATVFCTNGGKYSYGSIADDKRLMEPAKDHVFTGFTGEIANGVIQRLGLLQYPRPSVSLTAEKPGLNPLHHPLWRLETPPSSLTPLPYSTGYWAIPRSFDIIQQHPLIFGATESELSNIVGFAGDAGTSGFQILLKDGSERVVLAGKKDGEEEFQMKKGKWEEKRKLFEIDGGGGERVIKVEVGMNHVVMGIKITTNRNRSAFFGHAQKNNSIIYEADDNCFIAGIYASWGRANDDSECTSFSVFSGVKDGVEGEELKITEQLDGTAFRPPGMGFMVQPDPLAVVNAEDAEGFAGQYW